MLGVEGLGDRGLLVGQGVSEHVGGDGEVLVSVRDRGFADQSLKPEPGVAVAGGPVGDHPGFFGVLDLDGVQAGVEGGGRFRDQLGQAADAHQPAVGTLLGRGDQPFLVADDDDGAGRDVEVGCRC